MGAIGPKSSVRGYGQVVAAPLNSNGGGQPLPCSARSLPRSIGVPTRNGLLRLLAAAFWSLCISGPSSGRDPQG
jgi:hypothetical protein